MSILHDKLSYPVVHIAVGEHGAEVIYTFHRLPVISVLQSPLDSVQIHGVCDYCVIILKTKSSVFSPNDCNMKTYYKLDMLS